jgi:hypothetical protein
MSRRPRRLRRAGLVPTRLAMTTLRDACLSTNPRSADQGDVEALFLAVL